jgi:hypothetical protein
MIDDIRQKVATGQYEYSNEPDKDLWIDYKIRRK